MNFDNGMDGPAGLDIWRSAEALVQQHGSADAARQWALSRSDELDQAGGVAMKQIAAAIGEMERPKGRAGTVRGNRLVAGRVVS